MVATQVCDFGSAASVLIQFHSYREPD